VRDKFAKLFGDLQEACESTPVDRNYKWVSSGIPYT
jgi:hypothetical protein